ncbi:MAG: VWA domain-containing protein, partial [Mesorhizobium sp.]
GFIPQADTVRVEEMINYFPYDWKGPDSASTPFNSTVSVMPTPWNEHTRLMHVAIKGFDVKPAEQPRANLVFLIDVSGSMSEQDKLPLLQSAFRLLVNKLRPDDTVSIVTYAGDAGTVLEPTKASEKDKILAAIDNLTSGGSTAGEAGIKEAYRLAQKSFVKDGINRVMLATDGD